MTIKLPEKIEIDGIKVRPYLTLEEQKIILEEMLKVDTYMERDAVFVACVMSACTDAFDDGTKEFSYEEIVYSGLWNNITNKCPYIFDAKVDIDVEIDRRESMGYLARAFVKSFTEIDFNEITEEVKKLASK